MDVTTELPLESAIGHIARGVGAELGRRRPRPALLQRAADVILYRHRAYSS